MIGFSFVIEVQHLCNGFFCILEVQMCIRDRDTITDQRLEEIMVTAKLPLVEISAGKTSYRMDASVTQSTGSLYEDVYKRQGIIDCKLH